MKIGYARVSTQDQNLALQMAELEKFGCKIIFKEVGSAVKDRPNLDNLLNQLRSQDTVVVWKLDRLGRSVRHLIDLIQYFRENDIDFVSLRDNFDTTSAQGRLIFNIFASFAEFERELISERTKAGLAVARAKGRVGGRKPGLSEKAQKTAIAAYHLYKQDELLSSEIIQQLHISKSSFYRYIKWATKERDEII